MEIALYLASIGFAGIWFAAVAKQMTQPKKYLQRIINRSYLKHLIAPGELLKESVVFKTGGELLIYNLTEDNARSPRCDFVVYDEEARADRDAYDAGTSILSNSLLGLSFHISTAKKASIFEENYERIKRREIIHEEQFIFIRKWFEISFLLRKKEWYEEEKRIKPGWYFRQEHECSFEHALGAVFTNVDFSPYTDWEKDYIKNEILCSGIDWNPVSGHWLAGIKWAPDFKTVFTMEEHDLGNGYTHEMTTKQYNTIRNYYMRGNTLTVEEGGINEAYVKWLKEKEAENSWSGERLLHYEEWDSQGVNKLNACEFLMQNGILIRCDKLRFPTLAKQIEELSWDEDADTPKLKKDKASSPHALDAFLHAISELNRIDNVIEVGRFY